MDCPLPGRAAARSCSPGFTGRGGVGAHVVRCFVIGFCIAAWSKASTASQPEDLGTRKQGVDWPCFLGPTQDSKSPEVGIVTDWSAGGLRQIWQMEIAEGYPMPAISRGRLFLFDAVGSVERLRCLRSETGEALWEFRYPFHYEDLYEMGNGPRCCPVVDEDRVYIFGVEGMLHCLRATDGKLLWSLNTARQFGVVQNFFGVGSTPVVEGDLLIVQVGGSPAKDQWVPPGQLDRVTSNGTAVVALNKRTGEVRYQAGNELASYASPVIRAIGGRRWCFLFARGGLLGFDPASGKIDFHYPWRAKILESVNASNPVVVDDLVFISECYGPGSSLLRVRPGGYEVVWSDDPRRRQKAMQTHWNTPIHHEGFLYGSSGRHSGEAELRCIDLKSGEIQWSEPGLSRCSLLYVDGHLVCLGEYGALSLVRANPKKYEEVARVVLTTGGAGRSGLGPSQLIQYPAWAAPILSHGLLYVRGRNRLVCLELIPEK